MKPIGADLLLTTALLAVLSGCGGSQPGNLPPANMGSNPPDLREIPNRSAFKVLHNFDDVSYNDGVMPLAKLANVGGVLYGTTQLGGSASQGLCFGSLCGTVFSITTAGKEQLVYSFGSTYEDGINPSADLIDVNGMLYGTTQYGGAFGRGTIYSVSTTGKEQVIYSFGTVANDGSEPTSGLLSFKGTLYGTTYSGGDYSEGTIFSITAKGKELVLHSFGRNSYDGGNPYADLVAVRGTLYGTTYSGGEYGKGTIFGVTTSGKERILHSFGGSPSSSDGADPEGSLIAVNGLLYGTTSSGGAYRDGTVFESSLSGKEQLIYSFGAHSGDGAFPAAGLLDVGGALYGTTVRGGGGTGPCQAGCGSVFSVAVSGKERILYSFSSETNAKDGAYPRAGLIVVNSLLYGTTSEGGTGACSSGGTPGCGTVFAIKP